MSLPPGAIKFTPEQEKRVLIQWAQQTIDFCFVVRATEIEDHITVENKGLSAATESLQMAHDLWDASVQESERKGKDPIRVIYCRKVLDFCHKHRFPDHIG